MCCPRRIEDDNPLVSITPGELDNDNPWVTLTLTLTGQGLRLITRTHARTQTDTHTETHTHSGSIWPKDNTRLLSTCKVGHRGLFNIHMRAQIFRSQANNNVRSCDCIHQHVFFSAPSIKVTKGTTYIYFVSRARDHLFSDPQLKQETWHCGVLTKPELGPGNQSWLNSQVAESPSAGQSRECSFLALLRVHVHFPMQPMDQTTSCVPWNSYSLMFIWSGHYQADIMSWLKSD